MLSTKRSDEINSWDFKTYCWDLQSLVSAEKQLVLLESIEKKHGSSDLVDRMIERCNNTVMEFYKKYPRK